MATAWRLLILLASLTVWRSAADDPCDSEECSAAPEAVCAENEETANMALFADECVLRCVNCRMAAVFRKVNSSLCSPGTTNISLCPKFPANDGNEETKLTDPDDGMMVVGIDLGQGDSGDYDEVPPPLSGSLPLPLPLLSMGSELLRRLVMASQPDPQPPPPEGITLITADVKVDVIINMGRPSPPGSRLAAPPAPAMLPAQLLLALPRSPLLEPPPPPPPPPPQLWFGPRQAEVASAAPHGARPTITAAVASLVALAVAALHI